LTKKILVLGGSGFLGSAIIEGLFSTGYADITCGDVVKKDSLESNYIYIDLLDSSDLKNILSGFDIVINCVGQISTPFNLSFELNSTGIFNLLQALERQTTRIIQISSVAVYGSAATCSETSKLNPETNYATAKAFAESILMQHYNAENLSILRLSNLYGTTQQKGVIAYLMKSFTSDRRLQFNNAGDLVRYYLHVDDCVKMIVNVVKNEILSGVYNVVGNAKYSIKELISSMEARFNMRYQAEFTQTPAWENIDDLSGAKLQIETGFQPGWHLFDFIERELERNEHTE